MIQGTTRLIAHIGYPTETFKSPLIYNPYFMKNHIDAVVVPMGCKSDSYREFLPLLFKLSNMHGALITMPHKTVTVELLDIPSKAVLVAGACNAVRPGPRGELIGDLFDGEGFVRGVKRKGFPLEGLRALVIGSGGAGSAIAASLANANIHELAVFDANPEMMKRLAERLGSHYPALRVLEGSDDPSGFDLVVNATPLGMKDDDPLPLDVGRLEPRTFVGEVVMKREETPLIAAARAKGCMTQIGLDMLFEQIPAYLEFFGFPSATSDELREIYDGGDGPKSANL